MGNRVEELEQQVAELRAVVDGLTEELVETKERLSQLEAAADDEETASADDRREQQHVEFVPNQAPEEHTEYVGKEGATGGSEGGATAGSETTTARGDGGRQSEQTGSTGDDDDSDDIIVA
ncbi:MAG: hypothetical protein J07HB67_00065 [halophilic archaeon J07HB67]|jgi:hypothetical protein|nr:MAG: hypothetical protein J07HB67_00065 [halophilic archaeon J07HB67]